MRFATLLNRISEQLDRRRWLRLTYYTLVLAALIAAAVLIHTDGVAFVYNEF